jgi:hypothetical protein
VVREPTATPKPFEEVEALYPIDTFEVPALSTAEYPMTTESFPDEVAASPIASEAAPVAVAEYPIATALRPPDIEEEGPIAKLLLLSTKFKVIVVDVPLKLSVPEEAGVSIVTVVPVTEPVFPSIV